MMGIGVMMTGNNRQRKNYCFKALKFKGRCGTLYLHSTIPCLLLFDLSSLTFLAQTGQYFDMAGPGTYSTPHTVQCLAGNAVRQSDFPCTNAVPAEQIYSTYLLLLVPSYIQTFLTSKCILKILYPFERTISS